MIYEWVRASHFTHLDAQVIGEHLVHLREAYDGLTAAVVVKDAQNLKAPTHTAFEWNDTRAAKEYRLEQARGLLRAMVVVMSAPDDGEKKTRLNI